MPCGVQVLGIFVQNIEYPERCVSCIAPLQEVQRHGLLLILLHALPVKNKTAEGFLAVTDSGIVVFGGKADFVFLLAFRSWATGLGYRP